MNAHRQARRALPRLIVVIVLGAAASCSRDLETTRTEGVTTVVNTAPGWTPEGTWYVGSSADVNIGNDRSPETHEFGAIVAAYRLTDGRIVVADSMDRTLEYFSSDGHYLFQAGRRGDGPGEFRNIWQVWRLAGDTILT